MNKPKCKLIGENGNIYNLMAIASRTLIKAGMKDEANEMIAKVKQCKNYYEALGVIGDYVEIT